MTWNVQGAGNPALFSMLTELIRINNPQVLVLLETHISGDVAQKVCDRIHFSGKTRVDAEGFRGGIWMFWRAESITVTPVIHHSQHITVEVARRGDIPWYFSAIYASPDTIRKEELWEDLEVFARTHDRPWLAMGDFNDTRFLHERNGDGDTMRRRCNKFNSWLESNNWFDLDFSGPEYTWSRGHSVQTRKWARLDRAICNSSWRTLFAEGSLRHLGKNWNNDEAFFPFIHHFASKLQQWNKDVFHNIFAKKRSLERRLLGVQTKLSRGGPNYLFKFELNLKRQLDEVLREEEMLWFQKSRMEAICDGDRNTRLFHLSTIIRRKHNRIESLQDGQGNWIWDPDEVKSMVVTYFHNAFAGPPVVCNFEGLTWGHFPQLTQEDYLKLNRKYTISDLQCALNQMSPYKAPGPDGFQALFYQSQWEVVSGSLCRLVFEALHNDIFPEGLGETFIALIPKVDHPQLVTPVPSNWFMQCCV
ncbi:uncharacterized protein LOC141608557 [Silene latifolia]|uniref:uncharacterized protein LOC141608557 n=1 Tax=Silene latifolia TaxID=37657 RepID=UPI003D76E017